MKNLAAYLFLGLALFSLAGCPEKKPEGDGANAATAKPAPSAAPATTPGAAPAAPKGGGW